MFDGGQGYCEKEQVRLGLYETIADNVIRYIKGAIVDFGNREIVIGIEGQSYNSKNTSSVVDIAQGTGILKHRLLHDILDGQKEALLVFAPKELKNAIGASGNADKGVIFDAFVADPKIDAVKDTAFYKHVLSNVSQIRKSKIVTKTKKKKVKGVGILEVIQKEDVDILSPYNDIIDAYLSVVKIVN